MNSIPVKLAKESLLYFMEHHAHLSVSDEKIPPELRVRAGVFVSLKKNGQLRGCIGTILPTQADAAHEIVRNAVSAATEDPRFPRVGPEELELLQISVDVLGAPVKIETMADLDPKRYGVIVRQGSRSGVLLPDLEGVDTAEEQVAIACNKAGIHKGSTIDLYRFEVVRYK